MKSILRLALIAFCFITQAQEISIYSKQFDYPLDNVSIISKDGKMVGITDYDGKFNFDPLEEKDDFYILDHYQLNNDTIYLSKIKNNIFYADDAFKLDDIVVKGKPKDYIVLEGYFSTSVTNNDNINGFADGIMQVIIKAKNNKVKKVKVLQYRFFNVESEDENRKKLGSIVFDGMVSPPDFKYVKRFNDEYYNEYISKKEKNGFNTFILDKTALNNKSFKIFGYVFSNLRRECKIDTEYDDLSKFSKIRQFTDKSYSDIKHKTEENFNKINTISNFYTKKVMYKDKNELDFDYVKFDIKESNYKTEFWKDEEFAKSYNLYLKIFADKLVLQKNVH